MIDQYQVSTDKRSGITNDPEYIVRLLGQVVTVSLETVKEVKGLGGQSLQGGSRKPDQKARVSN